MSLIYRVVTNTLDKFVPARFAPAWNSPIGPKTVFFWSPIAKLTVVFAGIGDLSRPADQISITQAASLAATGVIWARYCLVIVPKLYALCAVNVFITTTQLTQIYRAVRYQSSLEEANKNVQAA